MHQQAIDQRQRLDFIWLELTARCNLECVHCYADSGPTRALNDGMRLDDWIDALDQAAALGCKSVQFIGGEPTLYPGLPQLIEHARLSGFEHLCVYTNGTHFTDQLKSVFLTHRVSLAFSVYGSSGAVHDQVTQRKGSFAKTEHALRWASAAGLPVHASIIAMSINADDVGQTERMLHEAGVSAVHTDRLRGLGRGSHERPSQPPLKELCGRCGDGKLCVSSSGDIYPCVFARFSPLGHIKSHGLEQVFYGRPLHDFRDALIDAHAPAQHPAIAAACSPEEPAPPCSPERDPGKCGPEIPPPDCAPEKPSICEPERAAFHAGPLTRKYL
ncbi:radical SAM/SPASM domain-containing protein [Dyella silvatica]|uniref:radical SAM/SPASM domain-containing protein n=1 Tax=Dyella silvatica TaxID=2992128 RepID=UPI002256E987|nr:radical SAM protein [Dyella silvatica]